MNHDIGLEKAYFKPTISDLLEGSDKMSGYIQIMNAVTINDENRLKLENRDLKQKITMNRNEVDELKQSLQVIAKHVNFTLEEFNKKFNLL